MKIGQPFFLWLLISLTGFNAVKIKISIFLIEFQYVTKNMTNLFGMILIKSFFCTLLIIIILNKHVNAT